MKIQGEFKYNEKLYEISKEYRQSVQREKEFALWLADTMPHHEIGYATQQQNIQHDIDTTIDTLRTISFKWCPKCRRTGNIGFELETYSALKRCWIKGWYKSGHADYWVFEVASVYYLIDKQDLQAYVREYGWDRITSLGKTKLESQAELGHDHRDAKNGLLKLSKLVALGLAKKMPQNEEKLEKLLYIRKYRHEDIGMAAS